MDMRIRSCDRRINVTNGCDCDWILSLVWSGFRAKFKRLAGWIDSGELFAINESFATSCPRSLQLTAVTHSVPPIANSKQTSIARDRSDFLQGAGTRHWGGGPALAEELEHGQITWCGLDVQCKAGLREAKENPNIALQKNVILGSLTGGIFHGSALSISSEADTVRVDSSISI